MDGTGIVPLSAINAQPKAADPKGNPKRLRALQPSGYLQTLKGRTKVVQGGRDAAE